METFIIVFGYILVEAGVAVAVMLIANDSSTETYQLAALMALVWPIAVPLSILVWLYLKISMGIQEIIVKKNEPGDK